MAEAPKDRPEEVKATIGELREVSEVVRGRLAAEMLLGRGLIDDIVIELARELGKQVIFKASSNEEAESVTIEVADDGKERVLVPEAKKTLLGKLKRRFEANYERHEGVNWADVERSLEADPAKLWSLQQMENNGHAPDVYMEDDGAYYFGTCSVESPEAHRDIVLDAEAEKWLRDNRPEETCDGNAAAIAKSMGSDLMDEDQYRHLQNGGLFDTQTSSILKTPAKVRALRAMVVGRRIGEDTVEVFFPVAEAYGHLRGFRGSLRVSKA